LKRLLVLLVLLTAFLARPAGAEQTCPEGSTCVPPEDLKVFVELLKAQKCRDENPPKLVLDPIVIVVDREGRVYYSGGEPRPYKVHVDWCNYQIDALGKVQVQVAQRVEPTWGFRFRAKAAFGYLPIEALTEKDAGRGIDGGVLLEPVFLQWANFNVYVGVRSVGTGLGFDVLKNMTVYLGYALAWGTWRSNPHLAVGFALW
jgi:hypothetical protein